MMKKKILLFLLMFYVVQPLTAESSANTYLLYKQSVDEIQKQLFQLQQKWTWKQASFDCIVVISACFVLKKLYDWLLFQKQEPVFLAKKKEFIIDPAKGEIEINDNLSVITNFSDVQEFDLDDLNVNDEDPSFVKRSPKLLDFLDVTTQTDVKEVVDSEVQKNIENIEQQVQTDEKVFLDVSIGNHVELKDAISGDHIEYRDAQVGEPIILFSRDMQTDPTAEEIQKEYEATLDHVSQDLAPYIPVVYGRGTQTPKIMCFNQQSQTPIKKISNTRAQTSGADYIFDNNSALKDFWFAMESYDFSQLKNGGIQKVLGYSGLADREREMAFYYWLHENTDVLPWNEERIDTLEIIKNEYPKIVEAVSPRAHYKNYVPEQVLQIIK